MSVFDAIKAWRLKQVEAERQREYDEKRALLNPWVTDPGHMLPAIDSPLTPQEVADMLKKYTAHGVPIQPPINAGIIAQMEQLKRKERQERERQQQERQRAREREQIDTLMVSGSMGVSYHNHKVPRPELKGKTFTPEERRAMWVINQHAALDMYKTRRELIEASTALDPDMREYAMKCCDEHIAEIGLGLLNPPSFETQAGAGTTGGVFSTQSIRHGHAVFDPGYVVKMYMESGNDDAIDALRYAWSKP